MGLHAETTYDAEVDAGYVAFGPIADGAAVKQLVLAGPELKGHGEIVVDLDVDGRVLGIELLVVSTLIAQSTVD